MIEVWLQITCDFEECGETDNSTWPNQTKAEYRKELRQGPWVRGPGGRDYCSKECRDADKANR